MRKNWNGISLGFTLIELLVAMALVVVIGTVAVGSLLQTLRGQNKIRVINQIKGNGQVVLDTITRQIRTASKIVCVTSDAIIVFNNGKYSRFHFYPPSSGNPSVNGYLAVDYPDTADKTDCTASQPTQSKVILTDTNPISGISLDVDRASGSTAIFSQNSSSGYNDIISIKFSATAGVGAGITYDDTVQDPVVFSTSVEVRGTQ